MGSSQQFSLRWNNYLKHITCAFDTLRTEEDLVDVTLSCEGKRIRAHKMLLSACSTYFRDLFKENPCQHPVIIFRNVKFDDLAALVDFMYQGEVNVVQEQLASFLTTAELLAVQGLTDGTGKDNDSLVEEEMEIPNEPEIQLQNTSSKSTDSKRNKSPSSPLPYHAVDLQPDAPPSKRRKCRENANANANTNAEKAAGNALAAKDAENKTSENQTSTGSDPVEIIPLMPNLKLEMPEYLVQDGSSCSYEDQSLGDSSLNKIGIEDTSSNTPDQDQKPDISQTFYSSSQSTSDNLDLKHQSTDVGHLLSKPGTSGERLTQEAVQVTRSHGNSGEPLQGGNVAGTVHNTEHYGFGKQAGNSCCRGCLERDATLKSILEQNHVTTVLLTDVLQQLHELKEEKYKKVGDHHAPFLVRFPALKFPLSSDEEISLFENILNSGEEFEDGVQELHKIGGDNIYQFVKRVLTTLLTNHLAVTYSWMGRKGKKPFNKSIIANLVICAAEKAKIAANRRDTETAIQLWLKRATDRIAGTSKKF